MRLLSASFSYGAFVAMQSAHTKVDLLFTRIEARDGLGGPIDTWRGTACLLPGTWLAVCAEGQLVNADFGGRRMASGSVGGMLGVGDVTGSRRRGR